MIEQLPQRIQDKIRVNPTSKCWEWTAVKDKRGYGRIHFERKTAFSHRVVFKLITGELPPILDHLCKNTSCCNPEHLEGVTQKENVYRSNAAQATREYFAKPRDCPQGHPLSGDNLYEHYSERLKRLNRQCRICRKEGKKRRRLTGAKG